MAIYEYRCERHGVFEVMRPMAATPPWAPCPCCAGQAQRVLSAPRVMRSSRSGWLAAIERAQKSRYEPEVVTSPPDTGSTRRGRAACLTPALRHLPKP